MFTYAVNISGHSSRNVHQSIVPNARINYGKQLLVFRDTEQFTLCGPCGYTKMYCAI